MNHSNQHQLQLFQSVEYPCSYLPNRTAQSQVVAPDDAIDADIYSQLIQHGFRRSGTQVYRPNCQQCQACESIRVAAADFSPNRSQKRTQAKWQHLTPRIQPLVFEADHFELYQRYQKTRHPNDTDASEDDQDAQDAYRSFILQSHVESRLVSFTDQSGQLLMVSLIDVLDDGISAVYTFYEPSSAVTGLGTFGILWQIELAQRLNLPYIYLGFWIEGSEKMAYKSKFSATQILQNGQWQPSTSL